MVFRVRNFALEVTQCDVRHILNVRTRHSNIHNSQRFMEIHWSLLHSHRSSHIISYQSPFPPKRQTLRSGKILCGLVCALHWDFFCHRFHHHSQWMRCHIPQSILNECVAFDERLYVRKLCGENRIRSDILRLGSLRFPEQYCVPCAKITFNGLVLRFPFSYSWAWLETSTLDRLEYDYVRKPIWITIRFSVKLASYARLEQTLREERNGDLNAQMSLAWKLTKWRFCFVFHSVVGSCSKLVCHFCIQSLLQNSK